MNRKFILRYLILIAILVICAGVAWYLTNASQAPAEDAVLARLYTVDHGAVPEVPDSFSEDLVWVWSEVFFDGK